MPRPYFDFELEENHTDDEGETEKEEVYNRYKKDYDKTVKTRWAQPAANHPDWLWVIQTDAWKKSLDWKDQDQWCDPDNFDMHIYTDSHGYGQQEIINNAIWNPIYNI